MKDTFSQVVRIGFGIVALAVALFGADALWFAPKRLPACVPEELEEGRICLETVLKGWIDRQEPGKYKIVWVDARSENDYELHHLVMSEGRVFPVRPGAHMQQLLDAAIERLMEAEERGECIVVFCTRACNSSTEIAAAIRNTGLVHAPIYVLEGGWDALKKSDLVRD